MKTKIKPSKYQEENEDVPSKNSNKTDSLSCQ